MNLPRIRTLSIAVMLACANSASANSYDGFYTFGDSLSDSGAYTNLVGPAANKFTSNPGTVWTESLGGRYGLAVAPGYALNPMTAQFTATGGNNYAVGGARNVGTPGIFSLPSPNEALGAAIAGNIPPVSSQVTAYLSQSGGTAD